MLILFRILLLIVSCLGYVFACKQWLKVNYYSSYIFVFCSTALIIFFSGMISLLEVSVYIVFALGVILFAYFIYKGILQSIVTINSVTLVNVAFVIVVAAISVILLQTKFVHYDNFSHWGIVTKYLLSVNAFPDANTQIIEFIDYPLGTTSFIYYVCKIVGNSQGIMLFALALLSFAAYYAMFDMIHERKRTLLYVVLAVGLCITSFFNIAIRMNNLLVDFLLPVLGLATIALIYSNKKNYFRACILSIPILGLLSVVKNTGIFFVILSLLYLIFISLSQYKRKNLSNNIKVFLVSCITILCSILPTIIWKIYFDMKFSGMNTKFSISQDNINQVTSEKTREQIQEIINVFFASVFNLTDTVTVAFIIINIVGILLFFVAKYIIKKKWYLLRVVLLTDLVVVLYYAGLLAMYIFLMPLGEAIILAGFERYICSIIVFQIGCVVFCLTADIERSFHTKMGNTYNPRGFKSVQSKNMYQNFTLFCFIIGIMILTSEINGLKWIKDDYINTIPNKVSEFVEENTQAPTEERYIIYASDNEAQVSSYYLNYVFKYMLFTPYVDVVDTVMNSDFISKLEDYDYLIVYETDENIEGILEDHFGIDVITGIYKIENDTIQLVNQQ